MLIGQVPPRDGRALHPSCGSLAKAKARLWARARFIGSRSALGAGLPAVKWRSPALAGFAFWRRGIVFLTCGVARVASSVIAASVRRRRDLRVAGFNRDAAVVPGRFAGLSSTLWLPGKGTELRSG